MKTLLSKLYTIVFCYLLLGVMFGMWNILALSLDAKLLVLVVFVAHALGEFTGNVISDYQHHNKPITFPRGAAGIMRSQSDSEI